MNPMIIPAAVSAVGGLFNAFSQGKQNRDQRKWNEQMYERQKNDNLALWNLQNEYNSPRAQMQRLQESGLNPNLVYGTGTVANNASTPDTGNVPSWSPRAPQIEVGQMLSSVYSLQQAKAQTETMQQQAEQAKIKTQYDRETLTPRTSLVYTALDGAVYNNKITENKAQILGRTMESTIEYTNKQLEAQEVQIGRNRVETERVKADTLRIRLENDLRKNGINPNDPIWMRILGRIVNEAIPGVSVFNKAKEIYGR